MKNSALESQRIPAWARYIVELGIDKENHFGSREKNALVRQIIILGLLTENSACRSE